MIRKHLSRFIPCMKKGRYLTILLLCCASISLHAQQYLITTIAGDDSSSFCCDGEVATNAELSLPDQVCLDNFGNLYIADAGNNRIRKIVLSTGIISSVAGTGSYGYSGDGGPATDAQLWYPDGICTDSAGDLYISDGDNHRIRKVSVSTGIITTIAGNGTPGNSGDGNQATNAQIFGPTCISMDKYGNLYFPDFFNNNVRKINVDGIITTVAGNGHAGYSGDGGAATSAQLFQPAEAFVDNFDNIIITDGSNHAVRKVDTKTGIKNEFPIRNIHR